MFLVCSDALLLVSPTPQSWKILYCNEACEQLLETPDLAEKKLEFWDIFDVSAYRCSACLFMSKFCFSRRLALL